MPFAEQVEGLAVRYGRRTPQLCGVLSVIAVALAGRAGERLAARLPAPVSDTTLSQIRWTVRPGAAWRSIRGRT